MRITVLAVPDCPHAPLARERIDQALGGRAADVEVVEVADETQAVRLGMTGSPTILIDGTDRFALPAVTASVSCRLYRGPDGRTEGAPSVADLQQALAVAEAGGDCDCPPLDAAGRDGRDRLAPISGGLRAVQQAILRSFAGNGRAPEAADLEQAAQAFSRDRHEVLAELAAEDFVTLDRQGRIQAAYPFSATPTAHRVRLADGTELWAMCAIDALGIPDMLGTDAVIISSDPVTGETITITSTSGQMTWQPHSAVVYVGQQACTGPAALVTCGALNFFTGRETARSWAEQHPDYTGKVIDQAHAEALGRSIFGSLLAGGE
ncbi:Alkylmercury lyase [Streptomyces sp. RB17]|uniref:alkylmercury lyase family protein n=1 Tax=Streptomyces sp. RB17 TaxID=2585197 RepID=UPI0012958181|nr:alkylmercury lyase family protein [Streptomyces sp. RB17]MQY37939.1 Alkylmercury lyase [Streptomyces sp. RB17]